DLGVLGEAKKLKAAAVGEDRAVPAHEGVQAAQIANYVLAWPQGQMIGVAQNHLRAGRTDLVDRQGFDRRLRSHRHESRKLDRAVRRVKRAAAGGTAGVGVV